MVSSSSMPFTLPKYRKLVELLGPNHLHTSQIKVLTEHFLQGNVSLDEISTFTHPQQGINIFPQMSNVCFS